MYATHDNGKTLPAAGKASTVTYGAPSRGRLRIAPAALLAIKGIFSAGSNPSGRPTGAQSAMTPSRGEKPR